MHDKNLTFIRILKIEINGLKVDLQDLSEKYRKQYEAGDISHYVFQENSAVLQNKLLGLEDFDRELLNIAENSCKKLDDLISELKSRLDAIIKDRCIVKSLKNCIYPLFNKVFRYVFRGNDLLY